MKIRPFPFPGSTEADPLCRFDWAKIPSNFLRLVRIPKLDRLRSLGSERTVEPKRRFRGVEWGGKHRVFELIRKEPQSKPG